MIIRGVTNVVIGFRASNPLWAIDITSFQYFIFRSMTGVIGTQIQEAITAEIRASSPSFRDRQNFQEAETMLV